MTVLIWQLTQATLFACSPQPCYRWRRFLLRCFGAKLGRKVLLRPSVRTTYPWKVEIGDYSWIGDHVELYSLTPIKIGANAVVSQRSYLCAGTHDHRSPDFPMRTGPIEICDEAWVATDVFVAPGVTIGRGAVIGARSSVFSDVAPYDIVTGTPARVTGTRI
jgi:putative colanic acid biosynthesis acetyltransferase WcaF